MKKIAVIFCILLVFISFPGCSSENEEKVTLKTFYDALPADISTLEPGNVRDIYSYQVARQIFEGLVTTKHSGDVFPLLAEHWEINGQEITFFLKKNTVFTDDAIPGGQRVMDANDVLASIKHSLKPGSLGGWIFGDSIAGIRDFISGESKTISGIEIVNPHTIKVRCTAAPALVLKQLATPAGYVMPAEVIKRYGDKLYNHPVGTGPYHLAGRIPDKQIVLEKNPTYHGNIKGNIHRVVISILKEDLVRFLEFTKKDLDIVSVPPFKMKEVFSDNGQLRQAYTEFNQFRIHTNQTQFIGLVHKNPVFNNKKLKQALNLAVDRKKIASAILQQKAVANGSFLPDVFNINNEKRKFSPYTVNIKKAKDLLVQAGYPGGQGLPVFKLVLVAGTPWESIGEALQDMMKNIGVRLDLEAVTFPLLFGKISKGEADMFLFGISAAYPSPYALLSLLHSKNVPPQGFNFFFYDNPGFDRLVEKLGKTHDLEIVPKLEDILNQDPAMIFLYTPLEVMLVKDGIKNLVPDEIPSYSYASVIKK